MAKLSEWHQWEKRDRVCENVKEKEMVGGGVLALSTWWCQQ